jgi:hypothetical protein
MDLARSRGRQEYPFSSAEGSEVATRHQGITERPSKRHFRLAACLRRQPLLARSDGYVPSASRQLRRSGPQHGCAWRSTTLAGAGPAAQDMGEDRQRGHEGKPRDGRFRRWGDTVDIIANKFLRLPAGHSKVVECPGDLHHEIVILFLRIAKKVFDHATSFHPRHAMRNDHPAAGEKPVVRFLC